MTGARILEILKNNLSRVEPRADGNFNAHDFLWALNESIAEAEQEEHGERMGDDA